ncbi:MAG: hypothetical protein QOI13_1280 [Paraburkholderia sp.]|nr:hypothetical protein [Paraburkholderia sp.]
MKLLASLLIMTTLAGCAQLQAMSADAGNREGAKTQATSSKIVDLIIPADALGARDPQLTEMLGKVGAVAAKQPEPTTVVIAALAQDFAYLDQAVLRGIPPQHNAAVRIDNLTTGSCQPYSVQVRPTE